MSVTETPAHSALTKRVIALCETILDDPEVREAQQKFDAFLGDEEARQVWQEFEEHAGMLHRKQHQQEAIQPAEAERYEELRTAIDGNEKIVGFLEGRQTLGAIQNEVGQYVSLTLELGRVPQPEDFSADSGCCGGGGGGGCGCG